MKIQIATPMYGGNCKAIYTHSLLFLVETLKEAGHIVSFDYLMNESLITRARNTLVHRFMSGDADALLFIDADQGFEASGVLKLVESGKDIIGGIVPMKSINWGTVAQAYVHGIDDLDSYAGYFAVNLAKDVKELNIDEPTEVAKIGTGMMFITRKVFEDMAPLCSTYLDASPTSGEMLKDAPQIVEYFKTTIDDEGALLSEDYAFCEMWRSLGNKVYAALWVDITHSGEYVFRGNFAKIATLQHLIGQLKKS